MRPTIRPTRKQDAAWRALQDRTTRYVVYGGAAGGGKSWLGCEWLLVMCYFYPGSRWFIGREELKRLRASTFITWNKVCRHHKIPHSEWTYNGQDHYIEFTNGSRIDLLDLKYLPSDEFYERFGSLEYSGGWIEEGGEVDFGAFDTLKSRINRHLNQELGIPPKLLVTCNPKKNWLYTDVYKPWREGTLPAEYAFIQAFVKDNKYVAADYAKDLAAIKNKAKRERLFNGNWEYDDDPDALITYEAILDAFRNDHLALTGEKYITADVALQGSDRFVIAVWRGWVMIDIKVIPKNDGKEVIDEVNAMRRKHGVRPSNIVYDADGVGAFVGGFIPGARAFLNGSSPENDENYENLKTQCYYKIADKINEGALWIKALADKPELKQQMTEELEQVKRRDSDDDRKLKIKRKKDIKADIGRSPDLSDVVAMRVYFELKTGALRWGKSAAA